MLLRGRIQSRTAMEGVFTGTALSLVGVPMGPCSGLAFADPMWR